MSDTPTCVYDVFIHDGYEYVYRVAIFGELTEEWIENWKLSFYDISDVRDHCASLAQILHHGSPKFAEGYGEVIWVEHNWRHISILDAEGEKFAYALVKRIDASRSSSKQDIVETMEAEWNGLANTS